MRVRSIAILAAAVVLPAQANAEPAPEAKPQALALAADTAEKPPTQLASAEIPLANEPAKASKDAPVKKRAARVTTCRCGGDTTPR